MAAAVFIGLCIVAICLPTAPSGAINNLAEAVREVAKAIRSLKEK
jgi:hypothetical protein